MLSCFYIIVEPIETILYNIQVFNIAENLTTMFERILGGLIVLLICTVVSCNYGVDYQYPQQATVVETGECATKATSAFSESNPQCVAKIELSDNSTQVMTFYSPVIKGQKVYRRCSTHPYYIFGPYVSCKWLGVYPKDMDVTKRPL